MGYYTTYSLTLEEGPREQFQRMLEDIDAMMGDNEMSSFESINAKWYSYETDIKQLSLRYPDIIFRVNGDVDDEPLVSAFADKSALIERLHLATANVRSNIRRCHGRLLTTPYSRFYHNKQILFVSLSYEINKCVNL